MRKVHNQQHLESMVLPSLAAAERVFSILTLIQTQGHTIRVSVEIIVNVFSITMYRSGNWHARSAIYNPSKTQRCM